MDIHFRRWLQWVVTFAVLTCAAVILSTQLWAWVMTQGGRVDYLGVLILQLGHWFTWALGARLAWMAARRWPVAGPHRLKHLLRHAGVALAIAVSIITVYAIYYSILLRVPFLDPWFRTFDRNLPRAIAFFVISLFHIELLVYAGVVAVAHAIGATEALAVRERDAARLKSELDAARLRVLKAQIQPHFLFNTLHTIGSLVLQKQNERAVELLAEFGDLLRTSLDSEHDAVPFRSELDFVRRYLGIEEARFGDRLKIGWAIDPRSHDAIVPAFILQPLVENAIRHGIARTTSEARLLVDARVQDGLLRMSVFNQGPSLSGDSAATTNGWGLRSVKQRLAILSVQASLSIANEDDGVRAAIAIPYVAASDQRALP